MIYDWIICLSFFLSKMHISYINKMNTIHIQQTNTIGA